MSSEDSLAAGEKSWEFWNELITRSKDATGSNLSPPREPKFVARNEAESVPYKTPPLPCRKRGVRGPRAHTKKPPGGEFDLAVPGAEPSFEGPLCAPV
jgi:hypothetical protein